MCFWTMIDKHINLISIHTHILKQDLCNVLQSLQNQINVSVCICEYIYWQGSVVQQCRYITHYLRILEIHLNCKEVLSGNCRRLVPVVKIYIDKYKLLIKLLRNSYQEDYFMENCSMNYSEDAHDLVNLLGHFLVSFQTRVFHWMPCSEKICA